MMARGRAGRRDDLASLAQGRAHPLKSRHDCPRPLGPLGDYEGYTQDQMRPPISLSLASAQPSEGRP
jgi:hypothetical protein